MIKKPFINALLAVGYIGIVSLVMQSFQTLSDTPDTILAPIIMISLFVLSAAVMGFLFLSEPLSLLVENKKQEAVSYFSKIVGYFACFLALYIIILFTTSFL